MTDPYRGYRGPLGQRTKEFNANLGLALTRWQYVETGLYVIAYFLMDAPQHIASLVFFHIKSGENKLSLVDKLVSARVSEEAPLLRWGELKKDAIRHLKVRNNMAHFELQLVNRRSKSGRTGIDIGATPHHLHAHAFRNPDSIPCLYADELGQAADEFITFAESLLNFACSVEPQWELKAKSLPEPLQRALATIRKTGSPKASPPAPRS